MVKNGLYDFFPMFHFVCKGVLVHVHLCTTVHAWCFGGQKVVFGVTEGCEPPCGDFRLKPGPLEKCAVLLTAESSL